MEANRLFLVKQRNRSCSRTRIKRMDKQHARESKDKERNLVTLTNLQQSILFAGVSS